ncbi:MAG: hypothetical protein H6831_12265 [Planctomycetes bacterium]|nr:hypothetical protein [Planctomycetota bacterium]MCB9905175.1 hypothetical protein [Planctomycetota bacterium]
MDPTCRSTRDHLAFEADRVAAREGEVHVHLSRCADCAAWLRRHERQVDALRGLSRQAAPAELQGRVAAALRPDARELRALESLSRLRPMSAPASLDGNVVAALHAGSRQERSLRHLSALDRLDPPASLDRRAEELAEDSSRVLAGPQSPAVLERLVSEDLADLPRALTRRFTSKLTRLSAPSELEQRVRLELARTRRPERGRILGLPPLAAVAAASLLLAVLGWTQFGPTRDLDRSADLATLGIDVRHLDAGDAFSDAQVDPLTQRLADELSNSRLSLADSLSAPEVVLGSTDDPDAPADPSDPAELGATPPPPSAPSSGSGSGTGVSGPASPAGNNVNQRSTPISRDLLALMESAHLAPIHMQRLVELHDPANPALDLVYQEELLRDGMGNFAVLPGAVLQPTMTPAEAATFVLLQGARQGYVERHRDFRVRDLLLFRHNYSIIDLRQTTTIAGIPCVWLEVQSIYNASVSWRLAVDGKTGQVLSEERVDQNGALLSHVEAVVVDYNPDLSGAVLDGGPSAWTPVSGPALAAINLYVPTALPDGYQLFETATLRDAFGRDWVRQLYSDGVGELFFLHEIGATLSPTQSLARTGSVLNAFSIAGANVLDGEVRGVRVIVVGLLSEVELLQAIDSALP